MTTRCINGIFGASSFAPQGPATICFSGAASLVRSSKFTVSVRVVQAGLTGSMFKSRQALSPRHWRMVPWRYGRKNSCSTIACSDFTSTSMSPLDRVLGALWEKTHFDTSNIFPERVDNEPSRHLSYLWGDIGVLRKPDSYSHSKKKPGTVNEFFKCRDLTGMEK